MEMVESFEEDLGMNEKMFHYEEARLVIEWIRCIKYYYFYLKDRVQTL